MTEWWRSALGNDREPSEDQITAITAPATGRHIVDAGAGTGKTSTLALRALYLIEKGHVRADQIVVITFTNKAAAEVGSRITDTIDRAIANGASFAGTGSGVECATIHALAARILREFAFDLGLTTPPRGISDGEAHAVFHEAFLALLGDELDVDTSDFPSAELNLETLERDLGKLALRLKNHGITPQFFADRARAEAQSYGRQCWGQLWSDGTGKNAGKTKTNVLPKSPTTPENRRREAERECANIRVVAALFADFDRRLEASGAATYGDLIWRTTRLLREYPTLAKRLRQRWRYVLLDESQDTSKLQLAFIETLAGKADDGDACGIMPVGDSRQAIYGFNGADDAVMERLAEDADGRHPLIVNRRSFQEIVDAGHAVLERAGVIDGATPRLEASGGSRSLECVRIQLFGEPGETIKDRVAREAAAIGREVRRLLEDPQVKTNDIAILVRRRTHAKAYVRALNEHGISAALDRRSGLFVTDEVRDVLAWMSWIVDLRDAQAAVRVLQSPSCGLSDATTIALAGRKGWLDEFLADATYGNLDADTRSRLDRVRTTLAALLSTVGIPLPQAVRQILKTLPIAASYVRLGEAVGAQAIANLRGFEELAYAFAKERPGSRLRDFVDDVKRRILYDDDAQEAELDVDGVRVLTIHQAKGLEWRFVFVACSTKGQYANAEPTDRVVAYDIGSGAFALKNDIDGRETFHWNLLSVEHDPETGERLKPGPRASAHEGEQARVFYVAVTRARERVYVTAPANTGSGEVPFLAAIREWAQEREPGVDLSFDREPAPLSTSAISRNAFTQPRLIERPPAIVRPSPAFIRPRISFTAISTFEICPRKARYRYRLRLPELRGTTPRFVGLDGDDAPALLNAARLGSLAHRALELWGRARIGGRPIDIADAYESALHEFADATREEQERAKASAAQGALALAAYTVLDVESAFAIDVGDTSVEGVIDLIARDPEHRLIVIDYKTGRGEADHYALQMALYHRVASLRYPHEEIATAILRLSPTAATFTSGNALPPGDLENAIAEAGLFESDVAKIGSWCDSCSYKGSPCTAAGAL